MSDKRRLIDLAGQLQGLVDQLLECAKEEDDDSEDETSEEPKPSFNKAGMIALTLKKKLGKY